jgi:restriction system protein
MIETEDNFKDNNIVNHQDQIGSKKGLELETDIEEYSKDIIIKFIQSKFSGHGLATIIESIMKTQGYTTLKSEPGKDEGIDILAGSGPLGFSEPRICVQVKSSLSPVDVRVLRELRGVKERVKANQGLLVSWGGFTKDAITEAKSDFFSIRLWDQRAILEQITNQYENFDDELKAELPLKRIWTLVNEIE